MKRVLFTFISFCLLRVGLSQTPQRKYQLVITNVNVVDVLNGKIVSNQLLAITGDTIQAIDDAKKQKQYKADKYLNAQDRYVLPGLWDMHVHFRWGDTMISENKALLPLFLAYGITTVRDAGGDITPAVMEWRREIARRTLAGPKIYTSGPKLDKLKPEWPGSLAVETAEEIANALDSLQKLKVDYAKIYGGQTKESYLAVVQEAERRGLKITGHIPFTVKVTEAAKSGLDAIEHMFNLVVATSTKEDSVTTLALQAAQANKPFGYLAALSACLDAYNPATASKVFRVLTTHNTAVVPTLHVSKVVFGLGEQSHSNDSLLSFIHPKIQATYQQRLNIAKRLTPEQNELLKKILVRFMELIPQMQAAGVTLLAGSDAGPYNSFVYPGESLHQELKLLVKAGLTPVHALQTATINAARFMGAEDFYGTIETGKSSDMLIIEKNPLTNIGAIDNISMVLSNGRLYPKGELNNLLQANKH
jgi:imidazolonepropionase-like amidohydrolase